MSSRRQDNGDKRRRGRRDRRRIRPTPAMMEATREQLAAGCRGDAAAALEAYGRRGHPPGQCMQHELGFIDRLGDGAPDWLISRWALSTALGWMLDAADPRVEEAARAIALTHEPPPIGASPAVLGHWLTRIGVGDQIGLQLALFDLGGLRDFAGVRADAALLDRAPRLREWADRPWSVFERSELDRDVMRVRDDVTGESYDVLHLGAANGAARDSIMLGRVAPTDAGPGWVFVQRPMAIDPVTADELVPILRGGGTIDAVAQCLSRAVDAARIPIAPGFRQRTWMWADTFLDDDDHAAASIVDGRTTSADERFSQLDGLVRELEQRDDVNQDGPTRTDDLVGAGIPQPVADSIATAEYALLVAKMSRDGADGPGLELAAANAASNLWYPPIVDGVREYATPPDSGPLWREIAACVAEPFRSICMGFGESAEAKARAA